MTYDPIANSIGCHELALSAWREQSIRRGLIEPADERERRWRDEGDIWSGQYETVASPPSSGER